MWSLLFTSGTLGTKPDENDTDVLPYVGKLGSDLTIEEGYASARLMAINHLAMMKAVLGNPHPAYAATAAGRGVLLRLLIGEPVAVLLRDDDLVLAVSLAAPREPGGGGSR